MNRYRNVSPHDLDVPGVGIVKAGAVIETELEINNPNFERAESPTAGRGRKPSPPSET